MASPWQLAQEDPHYMRLGEYLAAKLTNEEMTKLQEAGKVSREGLEEEFLRGPWEKLDIRKVVDPQYFARPFVLVVSLNAKDHSTCPLSCMVKEKYEVQWGNEVVAKEHTGNKIYESKGSDGTARGRYRTWEDHEKEGKRIQGIFKWKQHRKQKLNSHTSQEANKKPQKSIFIVQGASNKCEETITDEIRKILKRTYKPKAFANKVKKVSIERKVPNKTVAGWKNCRSFASEKSQERKKSKKKKEKNKKLVYDIVEENTEIEENKKHVCIVKVANLVDKPSKIGNNIKAVIQEELIKSGVEQNPGPNPSEKNTLKKKSSEISRKLKQLKLNPKEEPRHAKKMKIENYENSSSDEEDDEENQCEGEISKDESSYEEDSDTEDEQEGEEDDETNKHVAEDEDEKDDSEDDGWHQYPSDYEDPFWDTLHNQIAQDVDEERKDEPDSDSSFECDPSDQCPFTARMEGGGCKKCRRKSEVYVRMARAWTGEKEACSKDNIEISKLSVNDVVRKSYGPPMDQDPSCVHRLQVRPCLV